MPGHICNDTCAVRDAHSVAGTHLRSQWRIHMQWNAVEVDSFQGGMRGRVNYNGVGVQPFEGRMGIGRA